MKFPKFEIEGLNPDQILKKAGEYPLEEMSNQEVSEELFKPLDKAVFTGKIIFLEYEDIIDRIHFRARIRKAFASKTNYPILSISGLEPEQIVEKTEEYPLKEMTRKEKEKAIFNPLREAKAANKLSQVDWEAIVCDIHNLQRV